MRVLFIRHAESSNNTFQGDVSKEEYQKKRSHDPHLSELGEGQAHKLGKYLKRKKLSIRKIYVSGLKRSIDTGIILTNYINTTLNLNIQIHEVGGLYQQDKVFKGNSRSWFQENYPDMELPHDLSEEGWYLQPKRETKEQAVIRAMKVVEIIRKEAIENDDTTIDIYITHGGFMNCLVGYLLDRKEDSKLLFMHSNTGITRFDFTKTGQHNLIHFNLAEHLEQDYSMAFIRANTFNIEAELDMETPTLTSISRTASVIKANNGGTSKAMKVVVDHEQKVDEKEKEKEEEKLNVEVKVKDKEEEELKAEKKLKAEEKDKDKEEEKLQV